MTGTRELLLLALLVLRPWFSHAGEWLTARGEFCINECTNSNGIYWCYVSDPSKIHYPSSDTEDLENGHPDMRQKWDYCIPSKDYGLKTDSGSRPQYNQPFWYSKTTLDPITNCTSECTRKGQQTMCDTKTDNPNAEGTEDRKWFYCVDVAKTLELEQLTAIQKLWCIDNCRMEGRNYYWCNTLYGHDHCSPQDGRGSQNGKCTSPCSLHENDHYFCYTTEDNSTWEYCGQYNAPESKKHSLDFTHQNAVCADYCQMDEADEQEYCNYVRWEHNSSAHHFKLVMDRDYCRGYSSLFLGLPITTWIVIIVVIVCLVLLTSTAIIFLCCKSKGYRATSTREV